MRIWNVVGASGLVHRIGAGNALREEDLDEILGGNLIAAAVTDPPYSSGGIHAATRCLSSPTKKYSLDRVYTDFAGDNRDQRGWIRWCSLWAENLRARMVPGGYLASFTDWRQLPALTDAVQCAGYVWRGIAVWDKTEGARPQKAAYRNQCEYVVWATNGRKGTEGSPILAGVHRTMSERDKVHLAQKPISVMRWLAQIAAPDVGVVIDPFAGSGSTILGADAAGRPCCALEIDPVQLDVALARLQTAGFEVQAVR